MKPANTASPLKVFGSQLAFYRGRAGLSPDELGSAVFLSGSMIRKVENGTRSPNEDLVTRCESLPELGCDGALRNLFDNLRPNLETRVYPAWFEGWPDKESTARRLRNFEGTFIPGLLQTEKYIGTLLSSQVGVTEDETDEEVAGRIERQAILDREKPVQLWAVIDEAALQRQVGSREDMAEQLLRLAEMARKPHVIIQIIPLEATPHAGQRGAGFVLADTYDAPTVAYQDTALRGQIIEDPDDVDGLVLLWDALQLVALPVAASLRRIEELAETWN
jgi:transcriptional regulator with XRE-family HTH domain